MEYHLRSATAWDKEFLFNLHRDTMRDVIEKTWGWNEGWQRLDFDKRFGQCEVTIVEALGRDAGGLWLEPSPALLYIANIQVLTHLQGRGIGTAVLEGLIARAAAESVPLELSVLQANPRARQLYERLGFVVIDEGSPLSRMRFASGGGAMDPM
jgi:ribosomal protein S18 acetylase RimI-like enzyme